MTDSSRPALTGQRNWLRLYCVDALAKERKLSDEDRLLLHRVQRVEPQVPSNEAADRLRTIAEGTRDADLEPAGARPA